MVGKVKFKHIIPSKQLKGNTLVKLRSVRSSVKGCPKVTERKFKEAPNKDGLDNRQRSMDRGSMKAKLCTSLERERWA